MKRINKRDFDYIGILIGVIIGLILGYIVGSELNLGGTIENDNTVNVTGDLNYIYTLQIGKFDEAQEAQKYTPEMGEVFKVCPYCNAKVKVTAVSCPCCNRALN